MTNYSKLALIVLQRSHPFFRSGWLYLRVHKCVALIGIRIFLQLRRGNRNHKRTEWKNYSDFYIYLSHRCCCRCRCRCRALCCKSRPLMLLCLQMLWLHFRLGYRLLRRQSNSIFWYSPDHFHFAIFTYCLRYNFF